MAPDSRCAQRGLMGPGTSGTVNNTSALRRDHDARGALQPLDRTRAAQISVGNYKGRPFLALLRTASCSRLCSSPERAEASRTFAARRACEMVVLHVKSTAYASSPSPPEAEGEETEFLYECAASAAVADVAAAVGALAGLQARLLSLCRRVRERCADATAAGELGRALDEAEAYASKEQVQHNRFLSPRALREHIKNIEKKCAIARQESPETWCLQQPSSDNTNGEIELWWAGKKLAMGQRLCDYIGVNDKTKIVIRLTRAPDGP